MKERVRTKSSAPVDGDFDATEGTPIVINTAVSGFAAYAQDDAGTSRAIGGYVGGAITADSVVASTVVGTAAVAGTNLIVPKTAGTGIKVDTDAATFPWHDMLGPISIRGVGARDPGYNIYQGGLRGYQFTVNDEVFVEFHVVHDYLPGSDLYIHAHWSHRSSTVTGGNVVWGFEVSYAKGHNQAAFSTPITVTVQQNASTTQYQHMIAEVQLSAASPTASQLDSDNIEVDGLILVRTYLSANNITSSGAVPKPFLHMVDLHYQSTNVGTKQKAPPFWT